MDFSVVIPIFNSSKFVGNAINSVAKNALGKTYEVILVDDCSIDIDDIRDLACRNENVRVIGKPQKTNAADSRNIGFMNAESDIVFFLDSDDIFLPGYIERRINLLHEFSPSVIFGNYVIYSDSVCYNSSISIYSGENILDYLFCSSGDCRSSTLCLNKKEINNLPFDPSLEKHQDWGCIINAYNCGLKIYYDKTPGAILKIDRPERMSSAFNLIATRDFVRKYLLDIKHINGFSKKHWSKSMLFMDINAICYFSSIYKVEKTLSLDTIKYFLYFICNFQPILYIVAPIVQMLRRIKLRFSHRKLGLQQYTDDL